MFQPTASASDGSAASPARQNFLHRLEAHHIRPTARDYYVRWAETWINARAHRSADATTGWLN